MKNPPSGGLVVQTHLYRELVAVGVISPCGRFRGNPIPIIDHAKTARVM